ncbi:phosphinothricin acetyltransferase [Colwellia sp. MT41]|uniref:N-acetyltransferase n=1 Tax=Colwellia marinimaniae TaxID=1513592 RepID=A0ABQ0MVX1_9GAMM|nr:MULTISPECIES: arsinothricin resistance N-acetyltransferase ArsN1 family B [Colwellia]ALO34875.1 phosphinothricin acetyltransferase [Colwellia sp. MT41]GAW96397.1 N-acetyltransferase [Colwellia marinimaniae]
MIRAVQEQDAQVISDIYNHYITNTVITFEEEPLSSQDISNRMRTIESADLPWLVSLDKSGQVLGYAYASKWRDRYSYRFSVEVTVYLSPEHAGKGLGSQLYQALFNELKDKNIHSVIGGITLPNAVSVAVHEKFAMKKVAHFKEVGFKFNQWLDVGYWQGTL